MLKKTLSLSALLTGATLIFVQPAVACMSAPDGWYLEANVGSTHVSNTHFPGNTSSSGIGGNANLGYKFMPYVAVEAGYTRYTNMTIKTGNGGNAATNQIYSYDLAVRGIVPIATSGFEVFGKVGVGRLNSHVSVNNYNAAASIGLGNSSHSATGLYAGIGAQYYFMPELAINVQWQRAQGNSATGNADLFTGGISFIFD